MRELQNSFWSANSKFFTQVLFPPKLTCSVQSRRSARNLNPVQKEGVWRKIEVLQFPLISIILLLLPVFVHARPGYFEPWGKDADLIYLPPHPEQVSQPKHSLAVLIAEQFILFRQNILSPVDGPRSHFRPSSSSYMLQSIHKHGFIMGYIMGCDRLMRENGDTWVYRKIETEGKIFKYDPIR